MTGWKPIPRSPFPPLRHVPCFDRSAMLRFLIALVAILVAALPGCGGPQPVSGGTPGTLRVGSELLSDFQVTIHEVKGTSAEPVGFGVTRADGSFQLMTNGAQGPLWLSPGEYRCTLESAGAPLVIPKQYTQATTTPLQVTWSTDDENLELTVPAFKLVK